MDTPDPPQESVRVAVRCRPPSEGELQDSLDLPFKGIPVKADIERSSFLVFPPRKAEEMEFTFDVVFGCESTQAEVFEKTSLDIVQSVMEGFNGTVLCYGQTGAGKSHTMVGSLSSPDQYGITCRAFSHICETISLDRSGKEYFLSVSYLELYNENLRDLLLKSANLELKDAPQGGVAIKGLSTHPVKSPKEMLKLLKMGTKKRAVGSTLMNLQSSRSHSIFQINVESSEIQEGQPVSKVGKLHLVDLAGSERQSKTGSTGSQLKEATNINLSLSALGNVISALVSRKKSAFIPYRDSKLTRLLQDSLGGNTKTVMIANIGPSPQNFDETLSTLRFAWRAKAIQNQPVINMDREQTKEEQKATKIWAARQKKLLPGCAFTQSEYEAYLKLRTANRVSWEDLLDLDRQFIEGRADLDDAGKAQELQNLRAKVRQVPEEFDQIHRDLDELIQLKQDVQVQQENRDVLREEETLEAKQEEQAYLQAILESLTKQATSLRRDHRALVHEWEDVQKSEAQVGHEHRLLVQKSKDLKKRMQAEQVDNDREREEYMMTIRTQSHKLSQDMKYLEMLMGAENLALIENHAIYEEETQSWSIPHIDLVGCPGESLEDPGSALVATPVKLPKRIRQDLSSYMFEYTSRGLVRERDCLPGDTLTSELEEREVYRPRSSFSGMTARSLLMTTRSRLD